MTAESLQDIDAQNLELHRIDPPRERKEPGSGRIYDRGFCDKYHQPGQKAHIEVPGGERLVLIGLSFGSKREFLRNAIAFQRGTYEPLAGHLVHNAIVSDNQIRYRVWINVKRGPRRIGGIYSTGYVTVDMRRGFRRLVWKDGGPTFEPSHPISGLQIAGFKGDHLPVDDPIVPGDWIYQHPDLTPARCESVWLESEDPFIDVSNVNFDHPHAVT